MKFRDSVLFIWLISWIGYFKSVDANMKLILAQVVWRNGIRAPQTIYPASRYQADFYSPGPGDVVAQGMMEHVTLARKLKQRYVIQNSFLPHKYRSADVHVHSSNYNRTISSAIAHFAAFYSGEGVPGVDYPYEWMWPGSFIPVPVHTVNKEDDFVLFADACEYSVKLNEMAYQSVEYVTFLNESQNLFNYLAKHSGTPVTNKRDCLTICDAIVTEIDLKLPMVEKWARDIYQDCIDFLADYDAFWLGFGIAAISGVNFRTEIPRFKGGPLLWEMITRMQDKYENYLDPNKKTYMNQLKYYAYSGHDSTISLLFAVLDFEFMDYDRHVNPATSNALAFELWIDDNGEPLVKILYFRKEEQVPIDLSTKIHGCKYTANGCTLPQFKARSEKYRPPTDLEIFCQTAEPPS